MSYRQVRLAACWAALWALAMRWALYIVFGLAVLGAFSYGAVASMSAIVSLSFWPLVHAAHSGSALMLAGVTALHGLVGALLLWSLAGLLLPRTWAETERALPLQRRERLTSDVAVTLWALLPLAALYACAAVIWWVQASGPPHVLLALSMLPASLAISAGLGSALVGRARALAPSTHGFKTTQGAPSPSLRRSSQLRSALPFPSPPLISVSNAGLLRTMWRGPARRSARWWGGALAAALLPALCLVWQPGWGTPLLMTAVLVWQLLSTRLATLAVLELAPLHAAAAALPVAPQQWQRWRELMSLLPVVLALVLFTVTLLAVLPAATSGAATAAPALHQAVPSWRTGVWCALVAVVLFGNAALNRHATLRPEDRAGYWLFVLVLQLALASEVLV